MSKRKIIETSQAAYHSLEPDKIQQIYKDIAGCLAVIGDGNFEDIAAHLHIEKSRVWKRLGEMGKLGMIYRPGKKTMLRSGRLGYCWMLTTEATPKTEAEKNIYKKGTTTAAHHASKLINNSYQQPLLFQ